MAAAFPGASPTVVGNDVDGFEFAWTNGDISAGLRTYAKQVVVFLADAEAEVKTVSDATMILSGVFADSFVAVAALSKGALIRCYIAPAGDIGGGLNSPTHVYQGPIASTIDEIRVRSWSGVLDAG